MIFKGVLLKTILKMVLPEVVKMIKPLKQYVDEPNELDDLCRKLDQKVEATHDILVDVGKTANSVEEDLNQFKQKAEEDLNQFKQKAGSLFNKVTDLEKLGSRLITLQAMVDKFDRDQDYLDQKVKDISSIVSTLTIFKGEK